MRNVFFFTDLHGQRNLFHAMYNWCMRQDPECAIVYGGDAADRGNYGYEMMRELLNAPNVIYLMGNHEDMFVNACDEIIGHCAMNDELYSQLHSRPSREQAEQLVNQWAGQDTRLACYNGGFSTLVDWIMDGADEDFVDQIRVLPLTLRYENFDFCHSACTPNVFETVNNAERDGIPVPSYAESDILWDRQSLNLGWTNERYVFFGHTPTVHLDSRINHCMSESESRPCAWQSLNSSNRAKNNGWKIDMDTAAIWTGRSYVINCNTLTVYGFYDPATNGKEITQSIDNPFESYRIID